MVLGKMLSKLAEKLFKRGEEPLFHIEGRLLQEANGGGMMDAKRSVIREYSVIVFQCLMVKSDQLIQIMAL